jgi:cytochrome c-type biogenesis protein CcsB
MHAGFRDGQAVLLLRLGVLAAYVGASLLYIRVLFETPHHAPRRASGVLALTGVVLHSLLLLALWVRLGRPPLGDLSEALLVCAWLVALAFFVIERSFHEPVLGAFMLPLASILYALALVGPSTTPPRGTDFANPWFQVHVTAFFVAYAALSISFCTGLMYLLLAREIRRKKLSRFFLRLPSLEALDLVSHRAVLFGFPLLALGLVSGVIWAGTERHRWWSWEPKVIAAAVTAVLYLGYLLGRHSRGWRGRRAAVVAILGFALSVFTLVGGSLLGAHGHGF